MAHFSVSGHFPHRTDLVIREKSGRSSLLRPVPATMASSEHGTGSFPLSQFPTEIIEAISRLVLAYDVTQLYLCGNSALNRKLRNGGVRELTVHFAKDMQKWSFKLVKQFKHLRCFKVISPGRSIIGLDTHIIDRLPRELEVLEIVSPQSTLMWSVTVSPRDGFESTTTYRLGSKFPFLRRLKLTDSNDIPDSPTSPWLASSPNHLPDEVIEALPGSLREFETCGTNLGRSYRAEKLPRKLSSLVLHRELSDAVYLPKSITKLFVNELDPFDWLPPSLKSVMIGNVVIDPHPFNALPRTLLELHLPRVFIKPDPAVNFQSMAFLHTLDLNSLTQCDEHFPLPPNLTALRLGNWNLSDTFFKWIPQSLTRLDVKCDAVGSNQDALKFPKALKFLYLPFCIYLDLEFIELLPKTVLILRSPLQSRFYGKILTSDQVSHYVDSFWTQP